MKSRSRILGSGILKYQAKGERKSLASKAKKESSDEECSTSESEDEEYAMEVRDFKKFLKEKRVDYVCRDIPWKWDKTDVPK
ncbi:hypothetical protein Tco_1172236 [Tanacetum coccineum]